MLYYFILIPHPGLSVVLTRSYHYNPILQINKRKFRMVGSLQSRMVGSLQSERAVKDPRLDPNSLLDCLQSCYTTHSDD